MKYLFLILFVFVFFSCSDDSSSPSVITENLEITDYYPVKETSGSIINIYGRAMGNDPSKYSVFFDSTEANINLLNDTLMQVEVPEMEVGGYNIIVFFNGEEYTLEPIFYLVKSIYFFNDFDFQVNNFLVEYTDYYSYTNPLESGSSTEIDTLINSFKMEMPGDLEDLSEKNDIHYSGSYKSAYEHGSISYDIRFIIDEDAKSASDIYLSVDHFYSPDNVARVSDDFIIEIKKAKINYLSNHRVDIILNPEDLKNSDYSITKKYDYHYWTNKYSRTKKKSYKFLSITDSSEIVIKLGVK